MRIKIDFTANNVVVPFDYIKNLNGYLHKILGENNKFHDKTSIYSTSFLHGGEMQLNKKGFNFPNGASWYVSSPDNEFITIFINSIYKNPNFAYGMELKKVTLLNYELRSNNNVFKFKTQTPVLLKYFDVEKRKHVFLTFEDDVNVVSLQMKNIIMKKAKLHNFEINANDFEISFDYEYEKKKIKWIKVKGIFNKASVCPILIKTDNREIVDFIYNVGVGYSSGSGFGALF